MVIYLYQKIYNNKIFKYKKILINIIFHFITTVQKILIFKKFS